MPAFCLRFSARRTSRFCNRMSSVHVCVRPSMTFVDQDHIGCKSWKLIARPITLTPSLFVAQRPSTYFQSSRGIWRKSEETIGESLGKVVRWSTKMAISLKRVKIEEKLLPIGTYQRSFERFHPRSPIRPSVAKTAITIISGTGKDTYFKFEIWQVYSQCPSEQKPIKSFGDSGVATPGPGRSYALPPKK